eukprot:07892_1
MARIKNPAVQGRARGGPHIYCYSNARSTGGCVCALRRRHTPCLQVPHATQPCWGMRQSGTCDEGIIVRPHCQSGCSDVGSEAGCHQSRKGAQVRQGAGEFSKGGGYSCSEQNVQAGRIRPRKRQKDRVCQEQGLVAQRGMSQRLPLAPEQERHQISRQTRQQRSQSCSLMA